MTSDQTKALEALETKLFAEAMTFHQNYYEICSDWNLYQRNEYDYLKDFIGYAVFGPPEFNEKKSNVKENEKEKESDDKKNDAKSFFSSWFSSSDNKESDDGEKKDKEKDVNDKKHDNEGNSTENCSSHFIYDKKQRQIIDLIFNQVIEYSNCKKFNGAVLCSMIYNVIYNTEQSAKKQNEIKEKLKEIDSKKKNKKDNANDDKVDATENTDETEAVESLESAIQIYPVPVFKVRQYLDVDEKDKSDKKGKSDVKKNLHKTIYIDNSGRVYDGFKDYLESNTLPQCKMVVPKDGVYQANMELSTYATLLAANFDEDVTIVWLEIHESPASNATAKVLAGADIASTVVTAATMGVGIAAMFTPIGPGIAIAGGIGAAVSGLWTVGRSAQQLADRGLHGESINVTDKVALGAWIGIAGGAVGIAATGSTVLLSRAIRTGATVGRVATVAYDAVLIGNLVINGVGVTYKSYDIYTVYSEKGEISTRDILFLSAHLFFFCNSVINIRFAQNIIETSQGQLLKDYEASLRSNRHRKEFQRMARNTRAAGTNDISSNEEIIRGINKISNKDEFFQAMVRNRKTFSSSGAKVSFSDGRVTINSVMTIDPIEFSNLPKDVRADIVKGVSTGKPNDLSGIKLPTNRVNETSYKNFTANNNRILKDFCAQHTNGMMQALPPNITQFKDVLEDLRTVPNSPFIFLKLLNIAYKIYQEIPRDQLITLGAALAKLVEFLWDYIKSNIRRMRPGMMLDDPSMGALLDKILQELWTNVEKKINTWIQAFTEWLKKNYPTEINRSFFNDRQREYE